MSGKKPKIGKMKKRHILFSAITFIMFLILLEGGIRAYFWIKNRIDVSERSFSEYLGWETAANVSKKQLVKGYGEIIYSTQKYGFRRFGDTKTDKTKLFIIGDSFTAGRTVSDGNTYYGYLKKHNDNIEVFAYGSGGYGSLQEFMILDRYFDEIKPDLVLWQFYSNDFVNNSHELESASLFNNNHMTRPYYENGNIEWLFPEQYGGWADKLVQSSYLLRLFNVRLNILAAEKIGTIEGELSPDHPLFRKAADTTSAIMGLARERIGDAQMVAFSVDREYWTGSTFQDICKKNSIDIISRIPEAIEKAKRSGLKVDGLPYDGHWNSVGHSIAGEIIFRHLSDIGHLHKRDRSIPKSQPKYTDVLRKYRPASDHIVPFGKLNLLSLTPRNSNGFGPIEGPYPEWHMPRKVRWMVAPEASVNLKGESKSDTSYSLYIRVLSKITPQSFKVMLNGATVLEENIDYPNKWNSFNSEPVKLQTGENILKFQASALKRYPNSGRDLYVLLDSLVFQILPMIN